MITNQICLILKDKMMEIQKEQATKSIYLFDDMADGIRDLQHPYALLQRDGDPLCAT